MQHDPVSALINAHRQAHTLWRTTAGAMRAADGCERAGQLERLYRVHHRAHVTALRRLCQCHPTTLSGAALALGYLGPFLKSELQDGALDGEPIAAMCRNYARAIVSLIAPADRADAA